MVKKLEENIDLSTITAGVGVYVQLSNAINSLCSIEIEQDTVSQSGLILRMVESNSGGNWFDVTDEDSNTVDHTTTSTSESVSLASDFVEMGSFGLFVDVPSPTTGELIIIFNSRASI